MQQQGDLAGALAEFNKALDLNKNSSFAHYRIAEVFFLRETTSPRRTPTARPSTATASPAGLKSGAMSNWEKSSTSPASASAPSTNTAKQSRPMTTLSLLSKKRENIWRKPTSDPRTQSKSGNRDTVLGGVAVSNYSCGDNRSFAKFGAGSRLSVERSSTRSSATDQSLLRPAPKALTFFPRAGANCRRSPRKNFTRMILNDRHGEHCRIALSCRRMFCMRRSFSSSRFHASLEAHFLQTVFLRHVQMPSCRSCSRWSTIPVPACSRWMRAYGLIDHADEFGPVLTPASLPQSSLCFRRREPGSIPPRFFWRTEPKDLAEMRGDGKLFLARSCVGSPASAPLPANIRGE